MSPALEESQQTVLPPWTDVAGFLLRSPCRRAPAWNGQGWKISWRMQYITKQAYCYGTSVYERTVHECHQDGHVHDTWQWTTDAKESLDVTHPAWDGKLLTNYSCVSKSVINLIFQTIHTLITIILIVNGWCNNEKQMKRLHFAAESKARSLEMTFESILCNICIEGGKLSQNQASKAQNDLSLIFVL